MVSPENLIRAHLKKVKAYSSARDEYESDSGILLDANENAFGSAIDERYNRYPDPHHRALKKRWSELKRIPTDQIFFGNGSDEPIDLLIRMFCNPESDYIITLPPTYGMYEVSAAINQVQNKLVPLTPDFKPEVSAIKSACDERAKIIFLCTPNNPSGNLLPKEAIYDILSFFPGMVIIDEAYVDFSSEPSWVNELKNYPNLVVLQTLSKAWGMAGIRVGAAMASPYVIQMLERIKPPYNISGANQALAIRALHNQSRKEHYVQSILQQRSRLETELLKIPFVNKIHSSDSNFLLVEFENADQIFQYLKDHLLIIRDRSRQLHCSGCLRITIGTEKENTRLLELLHNYNEQNQ